MFKCVSRMEFVPERKNVDSTVLSHVVSSGAPNAAEADPTPNVLCLNALSRGSGDSQRIGRQVMMTSVQINGFVYLEGRDADAHLDPTVVRLALVLDKQTNGGQLSSEDVFEEECSNTTSDALGVTAFQKLSNVNRYTVLWQDWIPLKWTAATDHVALTHHWSGEVKNFSVYKEFRIPCTYKEGWDANPWIYGIIDNSLHLIAYQSNTLAKLNYTSRVRYFDL